MALLVENGSGLVGADSYASVEDTDAWWAGRSGADALAWAGANLASKEAALRDATVFLDLRYLAGGSPLRDGQGLAWPPEDWEYSLSALQTLRRATMMVAPLALTSTLLGGAPEEAPIVSRTDTVGELSESRTYAVSEFGAPTVIAGRDLSFLDRMLSGMVGSSLLVGRRYLG